MGKEKLGMGREKMARRKRTGQGEDGKGGVGNWFGGEGNEEMDVGRGRGMGRERARRTVVCEMGGF